MDGEQDDEEDRNQLINHVRALLPHNAIKRQQGDDDKRLRLREECQPCSDAPQRKKGMAFPVNAVHKQCHGEEEERKRGDVQHEIVRIRKEHRRRDEEQRSDEGIWHEPPRDEIE